MIPGHNKLLSFWTWVLSWVWKVASVLRVRGSIDRHRKSGLVVVITILVAMSSMGIAGAIQPSPAVHQSIEPGWQYPPLWVEVEVDQIELRYAGSQKPESWNQVYAHPLRVYKGYFSPVEAKDWPDYRVFILFKHAGHEEFKGMAWRDDYQDTNFSYTPGKTKVRQVLFDKEDGIGGAVLVNEFEPPEGGWEGINATGGPTGKTRFERFIFYGQDGYDHIHCSPTQKMTVTVFVIESDDNTGVDVASTAGGAAVSILAGFFTGGGTLITLGSTALSTATGVTIGQLFDNTDDVVGIGHGTLDNNGQTRIDLTHAVWGDDGGVVVPSNEVLTPLGEYRDVERKLVGHVTFDTRTRPVPEILQGYDAGEIVDIVNNAPEDIEDVRKCFEGPTSGQPGDSVGRIDGGGASGPVTPRPAETGTSHSSDEQSYYFESVEAALRLAIRLSEDPLPVDGIPEQQRKFVTDGVDLHVGTFVMGLEFGPDGNLERAVTGGIPGAAARVTMTPQVATTLYHSNDIEAAIKEGIVDGDIRVTGNGLANRVTIWVANSMLDLQRTARAVNHHLAVLRPTRYSLDIGAHSSITHRGESVTLHRNRLGTRVIDRDDDGLLPVVDRTGLDVGVTTAGAQRLINVETPSRWLTFSGPGAGVYDGRRTSVAVRTAEYYAGRP